MALHRGEIAKAQLEKITRPLGQDVFSSTVNAEINAGETLLAVVAIMLFYPVDGFLTAHAEERIIHYKRTSRDPYDDMGPNYLSDLFRQA